MGNQYNSILAVRCKNGSEGKDKGIVNKKKLKKMVLKRG